MNIPVNINEFYREVTGSPPTTRLDAGHFSVFSIPEVHERLRKEGGMPYNRRAYYKISLIRGHNRAEYADRVVTIQERALLFATPRIPYRYVPQGGSQDGTFCVFTEDFLQVDPRGSRFANLPLYQPGSYPIFDVSVAEAREVELIFDKLRREVAGNYTYKRQAIVNYLFELIHFGQKLQPLTAEPAPRTAATRLTTLFQELLDRQFAHPTPQRPVELRTAGDYARRLSVHVNHLNSVLKKQRGRTTSQLLRVRTLREAKVLLRHADWTIAEVGYALGFREAAHFSAFFRKYGGLSPKSFRG